METQLSDTDTVTLGGGCFWCLEAVFQRIKGVQSVRSGYAGGTVPKPSYKAVCTGTTGHAEVVQIVYSPKEISYAQLMDVFWHLHDPTTLNRQGADEGTQYRSAIFYTSEEERTRAAASMQAAQAQFARPIVTTLEKLTVFYPAEDYHQNYYNDNPNQPYCRAVVSPKVQKLMRDYRDVLKP